MWINMLGQWLEYQTTDVYIDMLICFYVKLYCMAFFILNAINPQGKMLL